MRTRMEHSRVGNLGQFIFSTTSLKDHFKSVQKYIFHQPVSIKINILSDAIMERQIFNADVTPKEIIY